MSLNELHWELLKRAAANPRCPRPTPPKPSPVLDTVRLVLAHAGEPMRARDIHAAAEELLGQPLKWSSVKATLAEHAGTSKRRFDRFSHGRYRLATTCDPDAGRC